MAVLFARRANQIAGDALAGGDKHKKLFIACQHALMVAFPHMHEDAQLATLLSLPKLNNILVSTCELLQPCDHLKYEYALDSAYTSGDLITQFLLMIFSGYTETPITDKARQIIGKLVISNEKMVRLCAIRVVLRLADPALLSLFAASDWNANANTLDDAKDQWERYYGSKLIILATTTGFISVSECIERITISAYAEFLRKMGVAASADISRRFDSAFVKAINYEFSPRLPDIELWINSVDCLDTLYIKDRPNLDKIGGEALGHLDDGDAWYDRQTAITRQWKRSREN
jgi:hypothetical protein